MFSELILNDFQKHKNLKIQFKPGVNVIVGESATGKSAIIRALYLLLENSPRAAEKLFTRRQAKRKLEIQLTDDRGNIVTRKNKKYYLNGVEFKAFKNEVPQPIRELFPLKEINWQRQHAQPFLIFNTSGNAAKILNNATGLEEQEEILAELKSQISETKSEIKRIEKNILEEKEKEKKLQEIPLLLIKARQTENIQTKIYEIECEIEEINDIKEKIIKLQKENNTNEFDLYIQKVKNLLQVLEDIEKQQQILEEIYEVRENIKIIDQLPDFGKLTTFIEKTETCLLAINKFQETNQIIDELNVLQRKIKEITKQETQLKKDILGLEDELEHCKNKIGYCPLCEREF